MIPFSCADYAFPILPQAKRFALLQLLGFEYVDIGLFERSSDLMPSQLLAEPRNFTKQLRANLQSASLHVSDVFLQIGLEPTSAAANDPSREIRSHNRKIFLLALDMCADLACTHLTGLPGVRHKGIGETDDLTLALEEASWRQLAASRAGVVYAIEPHVGSLCSDVASTRSFVESVPGLTLALDYGHFIAADILSSDVHSLLPFSSQIHARCAAPGQLQTQLSENTIDFDEMLRNLRKRMYPGFLVIEYVWTEWKRCNRTDNVSETLLLRRQLEEFMSLDPSSSINQKEEQNV
jgi:sugar phosphate isomerase/epimerase